MLVSHHKCVAGCRPDGQLYHKIPNNPAVRALWLARIPPQYEYAKSGKTIRKVAFPKDPRLCCKHFLESDYKTGRTDTNSRRRKKIGDVSLLRKELLENAVPSIWPTVTDPVHGKTMHSESVPEP